MEATSLIFKTYCEVITMDDFRYFLASGSLRKIEERFPLGEAVIIDIDPDGSFYDSKGPEGFEKAAYGLQEALKGKGIDVVEETLPCVRNMPESPDAGSDIIVADGKGYTTADIRGFALDAVPDSSPYVCKITDKMEK